MARDLGEKGIEALEVACDLTLATGIITSAIVLNEMRRLTEAVKPKPLDKTIHVLPTLSVEPTADCARYDSLRGAQNVH